MFRDFGVSSLGSLVFGVSDLRALLCWADEQRQS